MNTDDTYRRMLLAALDGERIAPRGNAVRRLGFATCEFRTLPLVTLRNTAWRGALQEFEWFMSGSTRVDDLPERVQPWWAPWGDGVGYGRFADRLREGSFSIWDPLGPLPPCSYTGLSVFTRGAHTSLTMYQRSCDLVLGAPHDWVQLWAYGMWLAGQRGTCLSHVRWMCPDVHVYEAHVGVADIVVQQPSQESPCMSLSWWGAAFDAEHFSLDRKYRPSCKITAELIV